MGPISRPKEFVLVYLILLKKIKMTKQTPRPEDLSQVLLAITQTYNIEEIYLHTFHEEELPYELVILLSNKCVKYLGELVPKITNTIRAFPKYRLMCYIAFQAKDKIREGNLFLYSSCQPHQRVYKNEQSDFVLLPENLDPSQCLELAVGLRNREQQKIIDFKEGYDHFKAKGKLAMAAFMLHQVLELTYRYLELLLTAKERISHSIRVHHILMKEKCTLYSGVFDDDQETDSNLLRELEIIYRATRYEDGFEVSMEILLQLEQKMEVLFANEEKIFHHIVHSFGQEHAPGSGGEWPNDAPPLAQ